MAQGFDGKFKITSHALMEVERRGLTKTVIESILKAPDQKFEARPGRMVYQSVKAFQPEDKQYIVRMFLDIDRNPAEVVTAYRSTKVKKYWRQP